LLLAYSTRISKSVVSLGFSTGEKTTWRGRGCSRGCEDRDDANSFDIAAGAEKTGERRRSSSAGGFDGALSKSPLC
jgi:hypothetical protein